MLEATKKYEEMNTWNVIDVEYYIERKERHSKLVGGKHDCTICKYIKETLP